MKRAFSSILPYLIAVLIGVVVYEGIEFYCHPVIVEGDSMSPTYSDGDILKGIPSGNVDSIDYGDVVVGRDGYKQVIKRVVGLPGDTLRIKDGVLYISSATSLAPGTFLVSEYNYGRIEDVGCLRSDLELDNDEYFLMGDNRNHSIDSREFGPVKRENIIKIVTDKIN